MNNEKHKKKMFCLRLCMSDTAFDFCWRAQWRKVNEMHLFSSILGDSWFVSVLWLFPPSFSSLVLALSSKPNVSMYEERNLVKDFENFMILLTFHTLFLSAAFQILWKCCTLLYAWVLFYFNNRTAKIRFFARFFEQFVNIRFEEWNFIECKNKLRWILIVLNSSVNIADIFSQNFN